jgi:putative toxin-antitoxin system antitoxin component (TIGR02293 family)
MASRIVRRSVTVRGAGAVLGGLAGMGASIRSPYRSFLEAAELVRAGLPVGAVGRLQQASGLTKERIKKVARISEGSLARRKKSGRLSEAESERLLRVSRVVEKAIALHGGDRGAAGRWLEVALPVLGGLSPLDLARTEPGAREVEELIGRIEHGVVS